MEILLNVLGGLGLFLYGMHYMSDGMQNLAGNKLRKIVAVITNNRIMAVLVGILSTVILQSSSISTVMVIGFVNAGIMTLVQSLGVIIGANIGTTITGWVLVLNIGKYGLPMSGLGALILLFVKKDKYRYQAMILMGLGLVFFGLELMSNGFRPLRTMPQFIDLFHKFEVTNLGTLGIVVFIGALLTALVQSSSATLGISISLAAEGLISYQTAVALVLGLNVGTTITALLASIGAQANAKRTAVAHTALNIIGIMWIMPLYWLYLDFLKSISNPDTNIIRFLATAHTGFNLVNGILFIPLVSYLAKFLIRIIPETEEDIKRHTQLDMRMLETPTIAIELSRLEIGKMGQKIKIMSKAVEKIIKYNLDKSSPKVKFIFKEEDKLDLMQKEVSDLLTGLITEGVSQELTIEAKNQLAYADEYESISDYYTILAKLHLKLQDRELSLKESERANILRLHKKIEKYFFFTLTAFIDRKEDIQDEAFKIRSEITKVFKEIRDSHLDNLTSDRKDVFYSTTYIDMLTTYRRINTHVFHVCEVMVGEKAI